MLLATGVQTLRLFASVVDVQSFSRQLHTVRLPSRIAYTRTAGVRPRLNSRSFVLTVKGATALTFTLRIEAVTSSVTLTAFRLQSSWVRCCGAATTRSSFLNPLTPFTT